MKGGPYSTRMTRTSRSTGETASHYRYLEFERSYYEGRALVNWYDSWESYNWWNCILLSTLKIFVMKGRPHSSRTTRTSRATGESASHYRHLEFERIYDEGRALVNSYDSYESFNWWNCISLSTLRILAPLWWREGPSQLVRVVQLVNLHLIIDT